MNETPVLPASDSVVEYAWAKVRIVQKFNNFELWINDQPILTRGGVSIEFEKGGLTTVIARIAVTRTDLTLETE